MTCYRHPKRETRVSCSECGRGICPDCMVYSPVGIRCPEHGGVATGPARVAQSVSKSRWAQEGMLVTRLLVAANVIVYLAQLGQGAQLTPRSGRIYEQGVLYGPLVADGEWWRLFTSAFLHAGPLHLAMNMFALWVFGAVIEQIFGWWRFLLLYAASGLAGSAGALLFAPDAVTVGASGAIFGMFGALLVLEQLSSPGQIGPAFTIIVLNLVLTFAIPGISIGGHLGGLVGGALGALALSRFGRGHAAYGRPGLVGVAGVVAIGVLSVVVAYWKVRGLA